MAGVNQEVVNPNQMPMLVDAACQHAPIHRGMAHIFFPVDYQEKALTNELSMNKRMGTFRPRSRRRPLVCGEALERGAEAGLTELAIQITVGSSTQVALFVALCSCSRAS